MILQDSFDLFIFQGNLSALQKLFEKMRKYQVKPTLESYAAALSCLGNMDLFDPSVARKIILDLEQQVKNFLINLVRIFIFYSRVFV